MNTNNELKTYKSGYIGGKLKTLTCKERQQIYKALAAPTKHVVSKPADLQANKQQYKDILLPAGLQLNESNKQYKDILLPVL